jgi:hypothetical protein
MSDITAGIKAGRYHQGTLRWVRSGGGLASAQHCEPPCRYCFDGVAFMVLPTKPPPIPPPALLLPGPIAAQGQPLQLL